MKELLAEYLSIPVAYHHFEEGSETVSCPFLVYYYPGLKSFYGDNSHFYSAKQMTIELYMDYVDEDLINKVISFFVSQGIVYSDYYIDYIKEDELFMCSWDCETNVN